MKRVFRRPSPAMVVAIVALIAALGGSAIAGGVLTKKKVNKIITKRAPGLSVSHATTADTATNSNTLGGLAASSFQGRVRWAFVSTGGAILAQSGGITNDGHNPGSCTPGCDFLNFGSSQLNKAVLTGDNSTGQVRPLLCGGSGAGSTNCSVGNDSSHILVRGSDSAGGDANQAYWIAVVE